MATFIELAKKFAEKILTNNYDLKIIISEINNLQYEKNGHKLTQVDVNKLIELIELELIKSKNRPDLLNEGIGLENVKNQYILKQTDTSGFNEIIEIITSGTKR